MVYSRLHTLLLASLVATLTTLSASASGSGTAFLGHRGEARIYQVSDDIRNQADANLPVEVGADPDVGESSGGSSESSSEPHDNNGHGNNTDGMDSSNPGQRPGDDSSCPTGNGEGGGNGCIDDELP